MDAAQADGKGAPGGLHALTADFDARHLLALLTAEDAHSINLWMQQRCVVDSAHALAPHSSVCEHCKGAAYAHSSCSPTGQ